MFYGDPSGGFAPPLDSCTTRRPDAVVVLGGMMLDAPLRVRPARLSVARDIAVLLCPPGRPRKAPPEYRDAEPWAGAATFLAPPSGEGAMSKAHLPPVPPSNRAPVGAGATAADATKAGNDMAERVAERNKDAAERNLGEQGRQGNIKQNTTNQGYQQDR
jgi:hypothetical protein